MPRPHRADLHAAAAQADVAAASLAKQGLADESAISRCMASHYRQQSDKEGDRA
jgi:hypothetical protein